MESLYSICQPTSRMLLAALSLALAATAAHAQVFSNPAPITFANDGRATLYPSPITVAGAAPLIANLSVRINSFTHTTRSNVSLLLVPPGGPGIRLMSGVGGASDALEATLTFVPEPGFPLPASGTLTGGVFSPTSLANPPFPAPAPVGPYIDSLAPLIGTNPNGVWQLFVLDSFPQPEDGSIDQGWTLLINQPSPPLPDSTRFTYQGQLTDTAGAPFNGLATLRFRLWASAFGVAPEDLRGPTITLPNIPIDRGLFAVSLDFGNATTQPGSKYLEVEAAAPPSAPAVTLSPRQLLTATPSASYALQAELSNTAGRLLSDNPSFLGDLPLYLRAPGKNQFGGLRYVGPAPFAGFSFEGPALFGLDAGTLGTTNGGQRSVLTWRNNGNVGIGSNSPDARLTLGGTPGTDGIRFPDATLQTTAFPGRIKGSVNIDPPAIAPGASFVLVAAGPPGLADTDVFVVTPRGGLPTGLTISQAYASGSPATIFIQIINISSASINPPLTTFDYVAFK